LSTNPRPVAVVATSLTPAYTAFEGPEAALVMTCVNELLESTGLRREELEFTIAGSCDYLGGTPFSFVMNLEGVGAWPPVYESHVEMDGAWALFEAWLRLQCGDVDTALVVGSGRASSGRPREVFALQTDPYTMAPLGADPVSLAGLQARALLDSGKATEADFAAAAARALPAGVARGVVRDHVGAPHVHVGHERGRDDVVERAREHAAERERPDDERDPERDREHREGEPDQVLAHASQRHADHGGPPSSADPSIPIASTMSCGLGASRSAVMRPSARNSTRWA